MKITRSKLKEIVKEEIITERLRRFKVYVSGESEPLILLGKNEKEVKQTAYAMIRNSSVKIRKVVKEGKLNEDWRTEKNAWSSKEAKKIMDDSLRLWSKDLKQVKHRVVKDWMSKAKAGVLDFFDIEKGMTQGDVSRAHPKEVELLHNLLTRDKIMDRFRSYFGGKKAMNNRLSKKRR